MPHLHSLATDTLRCTPSLPSPAPPQLTRLAHMNEAPFRASDRYAMDAASRLRELMPNRLAAWIAAKARQLVPAGTRAPDMSSVTFSLPAGGPLFGIGIKMSVDAKQRLFIEPGLGLGCSIGPPVSFSAAWLNQSRVPGKDTLGKAMQGFGAAVHAGLVAGGSCSLTGGKQVVSVSTGGGAGVSIGYGFALGTLAVKADES